jgi:hypothetical protein
LEDGTRASPETSRRLSCDAGLVRVTRAEDIEDVPDDVLFSALEAMG